MPYYSTLKQALPIGFHHFEVFIPETGLPYLDSAQSFFCTNVDRSYFKAWPGNARFRVDGVDIGTLDEVFTIKE